MTKKIYLVNTGGAASCTAETPEATLLIYAGDPPGGVSELAPSGGGTPSTPPNGGPPVGAATSPVDIPTPTPLPGAYAAYVVRNEDDLTRVLDGIESGGATLILPQSRANRRLLSLLDDVGLIDQVDVGDITVNLTAHSSGETHG